MGCTKSIFQHGQSLTYIMIKVISIYNDKLCKNRFGVIVFSADFLEMLLVWQFELVLILFHVLKMDFNYFLFVHTSTK